MLKKKSDDTQPSGWLTIEVDTQRCAADEVHRWTVPNTVSRYSLFDAVEVLLEHEGVKSLMIYASDEDGNKLE
jgi:hypothetical protein